MECSRVRKILFEFADMELPADLGKEIKAHLAGCQGCSAQLRALQDQMFALKSMPRLRASISILGSVRERVEAGNPLQRALTYLSGIFDSGQFVKFAGAATAALLVIVSLYSITGQPGPGSSVSTVAPPAVPSTVSPAAPGGPGATAERLSSQSAAPAAAPPPAPTVVRRETLTLAFSKPESLDIRTRSYDSAERAAVNREGVQPRMKAADKMAPMGLRGREKELGSSGVDDVLFEAKRAVALSGGKILDGIGAGHPHELEVEIPSENYAALLERLRSLGDISDEKAGADLPAAGSTVHLTLKFSIKD